MDAKKIIVALDYASSDEALSFVKSLDADECRLKVGKELFTAAGPAFVKHLHGLGFDVFLDLKFHDIPATVAKAVTAAAELGVWMVNVHASGGETMMRAAADALRPYGEKAPLLIAVTVLTSMSETELNSLGIDRGLDDHVLALAQQAKACGLAGVVCSAREAVLLRKRLGNDFLLVTPGIRPQGTATDDQKRTMTPREAVGAGVNYLVMGRPVRQAANPVALLNELNQQLRN